MQLAVDVWLPATNETSMVFGPRTPKASGTTNASVLLVGVAEHERDRPRSGFEEHGYRLLYARTAQEALTTFAQQRPACVLIDLDATDLAGLQVCRAMRGQFASVDTSILCLTVRRDSGLLDSALLAGADEILERPIVPHALFAHVEAALLQQPGMSVQLRAYCQRMRHQRLRLFQLQQQRERAASHIVHNLKEPLSTIDLRAALLLLDSNLSEQARTLVARIRAQVRGTLLQVLNLLDIDMLDEGRLEARYEVVDLFRMVRELLTDFEASAQARALTLRSDIDVPAVVADPDLLGRVLANLLDNAVRHAPNNTEVSVTVHRIAGARVELRVVDAGASIPPHLAERIFDAFGQGDAEESCRSRTGRGLGLAFCKAAVEAHRGEISVCSIRGRTVFSIKLPENYRRQ